MAECAIAAGLIRDVRPGEDVPDCLTRSLSARLQPLAAPLETFLTPFTFVLNDEPEIIRRDDGGSPVDGDDGRLLEVWWNNDHLAHRFIGPTLTAFEKRKAGYGRNVWLLLRELWDHNGPGSWTTLDALWNCEHLYWQGMSDEMEAVEMYRSEDDDYKGKTDDQVIEQVGMPRRRDFRFPREWNKGELCRDLSGYPRELRAEVAAAFAVLARVQPLLDRAPVPPPRRHRALLNELPGFEMISESARCPVALQWEEGDPCLRVLDDANQSDFESGEMIMGICAAFPFTSDPATLTHALERCALFLEVCAAATALTLKSGTKSGKLVDVFASEPIATPIPVTL